MSLAATNDRSGSTAAVWGRPGERRLSAVGASPAPDLKVPVLSQLPPAELPLGDAVEPASTAP
jgi:hypothetical protein